MNEEQNHDWAFHADDMEWHRRIKKIASECGASRGCSEVATIHRFVSLKALFEERRNAVGWAVEHVPFRLWSEDDLRSLAEVSTDNYVVLIARAALEGQLAREEAQTRIGVAAISAVERNMAACKDDE